MSVPLGDGLSRGVRRHQSPAALRGVFVSAWDTVLAAATQVFHGRLVWVVAAVMAFKLLLARMLVFGHAFGLGATMDVAFVLGMSAICSLLGPRRGRHAIAVMDVVLSLGCLAIVIYASYFGQLPSLRAVVAPGQVSELGPSILGLLSWTYFVFVIDLPFVVWRAIRGEEHLTGARMTRAIFGATTVGLIGALGVVLAFLPVVGGGMVGSYWYGIVPYEVSTAAYGWIVPLSVAAHAKNAAPSETSALQSRIDKLSGRLKLGRKKTAPAYGVYRGANLIVVQVEALQRGLVGARIQGQPVVPNLEALIGQSNYYPNTYSQIGAGNTSDAEFIANTSLYPAQEEASALEYARKRFNGLPRILGRAGYSTITFHTNDAAFWNRFQLYPALGFSTYADRSYFGTDDTIGMAASDDVLYRRALPVIEQELSRGHPLYAQLVTLSSHFPFTGVGDRSPLKLPASYAASVTGRYLMAQAYADAELGLFMGELKKRGLLDDSVIVVYGDHFGMRFEGASPVDDEIRGLIYGRPYNKADFYNIPLVIHLPGQTQPLIDPGVTGQIDIMPSVADLLGVSLATTPHFGRSVFVETPTMLTRPSSIPTYLDDDEIYLGSITGGEDRWYSSTTQEKRTQGAVPAKLSNTVELLDLSESYAASLPERRSVTDATGVIPTLGTDRLQSPFQ